MASAATVNGSSAANNTLSVVVGCYGSSSSSNSDLGGGGGDNGRDVLPDSSPDGGQLSLYEDVDQSSEHSHHHHQQPPLLIRSKELSAGEEEEEEDGSDVGSSSRPSYKRRLSSSVLSPSPDGGGVVIVGGCSSSSVANSVSGERSSKKRRKQSNPVRLSTTRLCENTTTEHEQHQRNNMVVVDFDGGAICREISSMDLSVVRPNNNSSDFEEEEEAERMEQPISLVRRDDVDENGGGDDEEEEGGVYRCLHCNVLFESEERLRNHVEVEHVQKALEQQIQQQNQKNFYPNNNSNNSNANPFDIGSSLSIRTSVVTAADGSLSSEPSIHDVKPDLDRFGCSFQQQHRDAVATLNQAAVAAFQNSKDVANLMALSAFGAAPFLIPLVPSSVVGSSGVSCTPRSTLATHSAGMITSSGNSPSTAPPPIRIFNPEAFCELCNKEFCNKYFLKTHKANKHGIYSLETLAGVSSAGTTATSGTMALTQAIARPLLQGSPSEMTENSSVCTVSNGGVVSSAITNMAVVTSMTNALNNGGGGVTASGIGNLLLGTSLLGKSLSAVMNPEAFCVICQKEFCNKYFLRKHRQKIHGIQESQSTSAFSPVTSSSPLSSSLALVTSHMDSSAAAASGTMASDMNAPISSHGTLVAAAAASSSSPLDLCFEFGVRDLSAKITAAAALMQQASSSSSSTPPKHSIQNLVAHSASSTTVTTTATTSSCSPSGTPLISSLTPGSGGFLMDHSKSFIPGSLTVAGHVFSPDRLREMGVINLDAFCEICCKEFCNKYFLRTHKLNKHGIGTLEIPIGSSPKGSGMMSLQQQSTPLSLVMDKEGLGLGGGNGAMYEDGRKSATPNSSNSSSSSSSSTSNSSGSGCLVSTTNAAANINGISISLLGCSDQQSSAHDANSGIPMELTCDVCSRPFSSGYLLKMHKFYFHNIGDLSSLMPVTESDLKMEHKTSSSVTPDHLEDRCSSTGGGCGGRRSVGDIVSSDPAAALAILSSSAQQQQQPLNEDLQKLQTMIRELNTSPQDGSVKCNICFREMKNKYFLRAHVMNEHGELHNEDDDAVVAVAVENIKKEIGERDVVHGGGVIVSAATFAAITSTNSMSTPTAPSSKSPVSSAAYDSESFCDLCGKEFCSKYFVRAHKLTVHGISREKGGGEGNSESPPMMTMTNSACPDGGTNSSHLLPVPLDKIKLEPSSVITTSVSSTCTQQQQQPLIIPSPHQLSSHIQPQHHHHHHSPVSALSSTLDRNQPSSASSSVTGRNFCEICNKELCNKYFMKTHMLKMHGINVDEKSFVNGATIGGVTCDICQKELCSKYFLKVHKQNTHGIFEEPMMSKENYSSTGLALSMSPDKDGGIIGYHPGEVDPGGNNGNGNRYFSHYTEVCPLCDRRFKSIKWLKTHIINDHADLAKDSGFGDVFRELFFGVSDSPSQMIGSSGGGGGGGRSSSSHQFMLSLTDAPFGAKVDKMSSSTSSSTTTSPNATATSPFPPHLPHALQHHLQQQQHRHSHHENDAIGSGTGSSGGGAAIHHAGELGSTGAAVAAAGSTSMVAATTPPSSSSATSGVVGSSPCLANKKPPLASGNGTRIYHCSYCSYSTRWLSNLYAHEKRHTGLSSEGEKRFSCRVCHRAYRYNHSLQRHLLSHKTTGFLLKHAGSQSLLMSSHHMSASAVTSLNHHHQQQQQRHHQGSNERSMLASNRHESLQSSGNLGGRLQYPDEEEEEEEEEEEDDEAEATAARMRERCVRSATANLVARSAKISSTSHGGTSAKTGQSRVKKYRCSKCGAKYRSREQCLEHIHLHHNTRNRHHRHQHHHHHHHSHQQPEQEVQTSKDKHVGGNNGGGGGGAEDIDSSFLDGNASPSPLHNCPRCTFSCSSQEALIDHLGRHHCSGGGGGGSIRDIEDETKSLHISGGGEDGSGDDEISMSRQDSLSHVANVGHSQIPMTYAVPQAPPSAGSFIMQPFLMCQPETGSGNGGGAKTPPSSTFVPSLVYLPVSHKVTDTITVSFNLTPA